MEKLDVLVKRLDFALDSRKDLLDKDHVTGLRLFSGFYEGWDELVVDLYASTLVLYRYPAVYGTGENILEGVQAYLLERLGFISCVICKDRSGQDALIRKGVLTFGDTPAQKVREHGVWYALDLLMHQDASFYLDTRNLRKWLVENAKDWNILNMFAYTGSLGVAALAGGARRVIQVDRKAKFLDLARRSVMLNHLDLGKMKLQASDFFSKVAYYKRNAELFDCVIVDPPFFSSTEKGAVDLVNDSMRVINKVRPLVRDGGRLVAINNALYLSGKDYIQALERLCKDGYLSIDRLLPVPEDITGYPETIINSPPSDPAPFNHPTKIVVLKVRRNS
jgi:23S rRNA (cytosine1962-C5)-methyltransferase